MRTAVGTTETEQDFVVRSRLQRQPGPTRDLTLAVAVVCWAAYSALFLLGHFHGGGLLAMVIGEVALVIGLGLYMGRRATSGSLVLTDHQLRYTAAFRTRVVGDDQCGRMVQVDVGPYRGMVTHYLLLQDADSRTRATLNLNFWPQDELKRLAAAAGWEWRTERPMLPDVRTLAERHPGSIAWPLAHPAPATIVFIVAVVGIVLLLQSV